MLSGLHMFTVYIPFMSWLGLCPKAEKTSEKASGSWRSSSTTGGTRRPTGFQVNGLATAGSVYDVEIP